MRDQNMNTFSEIETALTAIYQSPQPAENFLQNLEHRLTNAYPIKAPAQPAQKRRSQRRMRWGYVPAALTVLFALIVMALGPSRVLAEVQALFGYVPGVGFVDVNTARVLPEPLSQTQGDTTLTIKQVMSGPEATYVVLAVDGLPPLEELMEDYGPYGPDEDVAAWEERYLALWQTDARLTLLDGEILLPQQNYTGAPWGGYYTFPPLPEGVMALSFEVSRLPGIPAGKAAEGWHFDLNLGYAAEQPAAPDAPDFEPSSVLEVIPLPEPTTVEESSEETFEIKIEVVEVIYAETETTVRVQMEGIPEEWQLVYQPTLIGILTDDLGNEYLGTFAPGMGLQDDGTYLMFFEPVAAGAQTLTLEIPDITTQVRLENQFVEVDFGAAPQIGDTIQLESSVDVYGNTVNIRQVSLEYTEVYNPDLIQLTNYNFWAETTPQDSITAYGIIFGDQAAVMLSGDDYAMSGGGGGGGGAEDVSSVHKFNIFLGVPAEAPLPSGKYQLPVTEAAISIAGPYIISWQIDNP